MTSKKEAEAEFHYNLLRTIEVTKIQRSHGEVEGGIISPCSRAKLAFCTFLVILERVLFCTLWQNLHFHHRLVRDTTTVFR